MFDKHAALKERRVAYAGRRIILRVERLIKFMAQENTATTIVNSGASPKLDLGVDSVQSQQFGEGVFAFMLIGVIVFSAMIVALMWGKYRPEKRRLGEKLMFIAIIVGVVVAVIFGATQMLGGYLF